MNALPALVAVIAAGLGLEAAVLWRRGRLAPMRWTLASGAGLLGAFLSGQRGRPAISLGCLAAAGLAHAVDLRTRLFSP